MSTQVLKDSSKRLVIAKTYVPKIYQEYSSLFDLITPISTDEIKDVIENFALLVLKPTLNFGVREDGDYWYVYYMVYHTFDVSFHKWKFVRKADSHRHDTEAILLRVDKKTDIIDMVTISHYSFIVEAATDRKVVIEAETHAISPMSQKHLKGNFMVYKDFHFYDLNALTSKEWEEMRVKLSGASMPDEQYDNILRASRSGKLHNKKGDIFLRPDKLFKSLKLIGRI